MPAEPSNIFESQVISHLRMFRGQAVILDSDLAWFFGLEPMELINAVENNPEIFPDDFVFRLTLDELRALREKSPCMTDGGIAADEVRFAITTHGAGMFLVVLRDETFSLAAIPVLRAFANFWKENEDGQNIRPLVNRKS